jgi:hypothetical protein
MMKLTIQLANAVLLPLPDGSGYTVDRVGEHCAWLAVGDVTVAFDGRNNWHGDPDMDLRAEIIELSEYKDDPVRLDDVSCPKCDDPAETLLFALAANLGYTVSRDDPPRKRYSVATGEEL